MIFFYTRSVLVKSTSKSTQQDFRTFFSHLTHSAPILKNHQMKKRKKGNYCKYKKYIYGLTALNENLKKANIWMIEGRIVSFYRVPLSFSKVFVIPQDGSCNIPQLALSLMHMETSKTNYQFIIPSPPTSDGASSTKHLARDASQCSIHAPPQKLSSIFLWNGGSMKRSAGIQRLAQPSLWSSIQRL